ncbi:hypothetical protein DESPIGER_1198 [Desulfovibrio piger]|uniref:Uncharacterized protein n=1 Tax=Desulfovibrio piger TaxID=901 RepID=A0A1K1LE97_9BACT|nr:hypothetical protein DESPIGER_1198 [Desulfovibrio piger]
MAGRRSFRRPAAGRVRSCRYGRSIAKGGAGHNPSGCTDGARYAMLAGWIRDRDT